MRTFRLTITMDAIDEADFIEHILSLNRAKDLKGQIVEIMNKTEEE